MNRAPFRGSLAFVDPLLRGEGTLASRSCQVARPSPFLPLYSAPDMARTVLTVGFSRSCVSRAAVLALGS